MLMRESIHMAVRKPAPKKQAKKVNETRDGVEQQVLAFADQLGWSLGTIRAKADGCVDREAVRNEVMHIRNSAEHLLEHFNHEALSSNGNGATPSNGVRKPAVVATMRVSRGAVDAPGKKHRKPPPPEAIDKRMGEPVGKKMGQKSGKHAMRYGRS
jgi:hypothetical protein